jgi:hypothetical protein
VTWWGGVGVRRGHDAGTEEAGDGQCGTAAWSGDRGGAWVVPGGRGPVALGRSRALCCF